MTEKLIRFTASWCQPCKMLAMNLKDEDLGIPVEVVDIDVNPDTVQEYGIRGVPTIVHVPSRKAISGVRTAGELRNWIEQCRA